MYNRRGPPRSTPTSVLCQKCLKKGHYSYECKVALQDRPYKAQPSRSQQLRNPKLAPRLHEETFDALQIKQGVADEELAKREAERVKRRRRDSISSSGSDSDSESGRGHRGATGKQTSRRRSPSHSGSDSRSTSRSPSRSVSPPHRTTTATAEHGPSGARRSQREGSVSNDASKSRSASPPPRRGVERSRSPVARDNRMRSSDFFGAAAASGDQQEHGSQHDQDKNRTRHRHNSRSPGRGDRHHRSYRERDAERSKRHDSHQGRSKHDDRGDSRRPPPPAERDAGVEHRERSLSPFSRRVALTKATRSGKQA